MGCVKARRSIERPLPQLALVEAQGDQRARLGDGRQQLASGGLLRIREARETSLTPDHSPAKQVKALEHSARDIRRQRLVTQLEARGEPELSGREADLPPGAQVHQIGAGESE